MYHFRLAENLAVYNLPRTKSKRQHAQRKQQILVMLLNDTQEYYHISCKGV